MSRQKNVFKSVGNTTRRRRRLSWLIQLLLFDFREERLNQWSASLTYSNKDFLGMDDSPLDNRDRALVNIVACVSTCNLSGDTQTSQSNSNRHLEEINRSNHHPPKSLITFGERTNGRWRWWWGVLIRTRHRTSSFLYLFTVTNRFLSIPAR